MAALFYSLIETAKLCNVEPKDYLLQTARAAIARPARVEYPRSFVLPSDALNGVNR